MIELTMAGESMMLTRSQKFYGSLLLFAALSLSPVFAQPPDGRYFGPGEPASISELPAGDFRDALLSLAPDAQARALQVLRANAFPAADVAHMRVDSRGDVLYEDPAPAAETGPGDPAPASAIPASEAFLLHSKPGAANVLYIDFDGHDLISTVWSSYSGQSPLYAKPYSRDADHTQFSDTEIDIIAESWRRVAEDFAPFDVDVTTEEPPFTVNPTSGRIEYGPNVGHILITDEQDENGYWIYTQGGCGCGGVAYYNGFGDSYYSPGLVFNTSLNGVSEAISHEFGHNLNLSHDGTATSSYYSGHGSGTVSWGPIMGAAYSVVLSQWSKGEYLGANNQQDDLARIASVLGYDIDDHADTDLGTATPLQVTGGVNVVSSGRVSDPAGTSLANRGVIEDRNDRDLFVLSIGAGQIDLSVTPAHLETYIANERSNLDLQVRLLDASGTELQSSNPDLGTSASIYYAASAGTYYLEVRGVGRGDPLADGYTDYGSLGEYFINGTVPQDVVATQPPVAPDDLSATLVSDVNIRLDWTDPVSVPEANEAGYRVLRSDNGGSFALIASLPRDSSTYADNNLANGHYAYQLEVYNAVGQDQSAATAPLTVDRPSIAVASAESTLFGTIESGSYLSTQQASGSEVLREQHSGGKPANRRSYLEHSWTVSGVVAGASVRIELSATAPANTEGDDFIFSYAVNGGPDQPLGTLVQGSSQTFDVALDPTTSGSVVITVVDADQSTRGAAALDSVEVHRIAVLSSGDPAEQPPVVSIDAPAQGTTVPGGTAVSFSATASDFEDGDLSHAISWSSDIDGALGSGPDISVVLSGGTPASSHIVTATVTDSASQPAQDAVTVHVDDTPVASAMSVADLDGSSSAARGGKWQASARITVHDDLGEPVGGALVEGDWSAGASGSGSCTTDAAGSCEIAKGGLKNNVPSVVFTVGAVSGTLAYDATANSDPDGDSDGTSLSIARP